MSERLRTALACVLLFLINGFIARELFVIEFTSFNGSIEAAYIALSRQIITQWPDFDWFPLWYGGIPFQNTYPPFLHFVVAGVAWVTGGSTGWAHHAVSALFYSLGPVFLYLLVWRLSGSRIQAIVAAVLYSVLAPSAWLIEAVRGDLGTVWGPRRLHALVKYGEGPHITSLALIPLALLLFHEAVERRRWIWWIAAAAGVALLPLTNWLGAFGLTALLLAYLSARTRELGIRLWGQALLLGIYAYCLAMPWIPPSTLAAIRVNSQRIGGAFQMGAPQLAGGLALAVALAGMVVLLYRLRISWYPVFVSLSAFTLAAIPLLAEWFQFSLVPQPERYHLEMDLTLAMAAGIVAGTAVTRSVARAICITLVIFLALYGFTRSNSYAGHLIRPFDMSASTEAAMARVFQQDYSGGRVFAPGSAGFWLNLYTDTHQIGGGFDQGITNQLLPVATYQILSGDGAGNREADIAIAWLKALGVDAIGVTGPGSTEAYLPFRNPDKFEGVLEKTWSAPGAAVYAIPRRHSSLAWVIRPQDAATRTPNGGLDVEPLSPYLRAMDDPALPVATSNWVSRSELQIQTDLHPGLLVSLQIAWHPGWRAYVGDLPVPLVKDELNQIRLAPGCDGPCKIIVRFEPNTEQAIAKGLQLTALVVPIMLVFPGKTRSYKDRTRL